MKRFSVLVVDDEPLIGHLLKKSLEKSFDVEVVHSVERGIQLLEENEYDCLITDLSFPMDSGIRVIKKLKERSYNTPIFVVSGLDTSDSHSMEAKSLGIDQFLSKPIKDLNEFSKQVLTAVG